MAFDRIKSNDLYQAEIEELTPEEFSYYLAHGSLEIDAELN